MLQRILWPFALTLLGLACSGKALILSDGQSSADSGATASSGNSVGAGGLASSTTGGTGGKGDSTASGTGGGGGGGGGGGPACPDGTTTCNGACVQLATDLLHCGACGNACPPVAGAFATCSAGTCGFACVSGKDDCNADPSDGCEQDLLADPLHCGACGNACPNKQACTGFCNPKSCLGALGFKAKAEFPLLCWGYWDLAVGDVDGDGAREVLGSGCTAKLYENQGSGLLAAPVPLVGLKGLAEAYDVALADLNGDGLVDLAFAGYDSTNIVVALRQADGTYVATAYSSYQDGLLGYPKAIASGDFDGDGDVDLAYSNSSPKNKAVAIRLNDGTGAFGKASALDTLAGNGWNLSILAADVDADGKADLVLHDASNPNMPAGALSIHRSLGGGSFAPHVDFPAAPAPGNTAPSSLLSGDFDADGRLDLVAVGKGVTQVHLGDGKGGFALKTTLPDALAHKATLGDFDGDGRLDLAVARALFNPFMPDFLSVAVHRGKGDGTFEPMLELPVTTKEFYSSEPSLAAGDLDGDGKDELVAQGTRDANGKGVVTVFPGACL
ncbi:MAG: VCBS repeat-containing protein [Deltaproteobacteria bacterium]|nr:VCBS repeat-containing protein [Deltaproteobacteria bacterium]